MKQSNSETVRVAFLVVDLEPVDCDTETVGGASRRSIVNFCDQKARN